MALVRPFAGKRPAIADGVFLAETAVVIGDVTLGADSTIWYGAVLRGDVHWIKIGKETSIQDNAVVHVTGGKTWTEVGNRVTVGHAAILHGCKVEDRCLIGMGSVILDGAVIGAQSMVAAGALVSPGTIVPPRTLMLGSPARPKRLLTDAELDWIEVSADHYVALGKTYISPTND